MINPDSNRQGDFLPDDQVPASLLPVLQRMFDEQVPVLLETARQLQQWVAANPDTNEIPRAIGSLRYRLGDMQEERLSLPFNLWMWQRPHDFFAGLDDQDRAAVAELFSAEQITALTAPLPVRVQRQHNRLVRG